MATSPALIKAMVEAVGEPKVSTEVALRRLREANLVPVGGRGPYAVKMDYTSAMRLLLGVCASVPLERDAAKNAVHRFERLAGGLNDREVIASEGWDPYKVKFAIDHLDPEHALGDALISLLKAGATDRLYSFEDKTGRIEAPFRNSVLKGYVRVVFFLPVPMALIEHQVGHARKVWRYGYPAGASIQNYISIARERRLGGRMQTTEIDGSCFEIIGSAIAGSE